ncbi:glycosyltransferase, group 1 family protein [Citrobacter freundii]|nr:glycosyltransferase WbuB [Citrobacter freundii]EGT3578555.1 glycosyltransferase family 4 protein [Citrobacter freundii]KWZ92943.1 glycosyltransferase, group 1 family protein [Citrobacter freundii]
MKVFMSKSIWYISKYFSAKTKNSAGGRDWFLMNALGKLGFDVTVIASDSNTASEVPVISSAVQKDQRDNLVIYWLKTYKYTIPKSAKRVLSWFHFEWLLFKLNKKDLHRPDVVIASSLSLFSIVNGCLLRRKYGCKLVLEVRDIWPLTIVEEGGFNPKHPFVMLLARLERFAYKTADVIVGTMPNLGEHVHNILGFQKPTYCVPMGFDPNVLSIQENVDEEIVKKYFKDGKFHVVYAGTIGITNALDTIFEAAEKLVDNEHIHFVILGEGALKSKYMRRYAHCNNISFMPKVSRLMVQSVLKNADALYLSAFDSKVWQYGQSLNKIIDYMVAARPIIASYSGYQSMINEAESGFFVPSENVNAVVEKILLLKDMSKQDRNAMGERGLEWILHNRNYDKLARYYADIIFQ